MKRRVPQLDECYSSCPSLEDDGSSSIIFLLNGTKSRSRDNFQFLRSGRINETNSGAKLLGKIWKSFQSCLHKKSKVNGKFYTMQSTQSDDIDDFKDITFDSSVGRENSFLEDPMDNEQSFVDCYDEDVALYSKTTFLSRWMPMFNKDIQNSNMAATKNFTKKINHSVPLDMPELQIMKRMTSPKQERTNKTISSTSRTTVIHNDASSTRTVGHTFQSIQMIEAKTRQTARYVRPDTLVSPTVDIYGTIPQIVAIPDGEIKHEGTTSHQAQSSRVAKQNDLVSHPISSIQYYPPHSLPVESARKFDSQCDTHSDSQTMEIDSYGYNLFHYLTDSFQGSLESVDSLVESYWDPEEADEENDQNSSESVHIPWQSDGDSHYATSFYQDQDATIEFVSQNEKLNEQPSFTSNNVAGPISNDDYHLIEHLNFLLVRTKPQTVKILYDKNNRKIN